MRKKVFGRRLKRDTNERTALFKGLLSSLVLKDAIKTTEAKAKAIKPTADKVVNFAKKEGLYAKGLLSPYLTPLAIEKCIEEVAPRFTGRTSGYTRSVRLGNRISDNAPLVLMEWVEKSKKVVPVIPKSGTQKVEIAKKEAKPNSDRDKSATKKKRETKPKTQKKS